MIQRLMMMVMDWTLWKVMMIESSWLIGDWKNKHDDDDDWMIGGDLNEQIWTVLFSLSLPSSAPDWFFAKRPDSLFCEISSTNISIFCKGLFLWCWKFICSTCPHSWDRNRISIQSKNISNRNSAGSSEAAFNITPLQKGVELPSSPLNKYHRVYIWKKFS